MKKLILAALALSFICACAYIMITPENELSEMDAKRKKHAEFLANSPFKDTKNLSKEQRKGLSLPPNAYNERLWELTMNPELGYPTPYKIDVQKMTDRALAKGTPGTDGSQWKERGPLLVGGRTRVIFYDPNDVGANNGDGTDYNRVFAGAVGGGLWVNNNINSLLSSWDQVPGIAASLNISCYAIDPNDSNTIYLGTGEQYTDGAAVGNGLYKSTDGGTTWARVDIPLAGPEEDNLEGGTLFSSGIFHINDIAIRDVDGTSEIYVGVGSSAYWSPNFTTSNPLNILGAGNAGLYRSVDGGDNWERNESFALRFFSSSGEQFPVIPNDFEISADNSLYFGSIATRGLGSGGGGAIFKSTNGLNWTREQSISGGDRVEIEPSTTNPDKFYVLAQVSGQADLFLTEDDFDTFNPISEPNDVDNGIPAEDFTRGQSFYDLMIEADPNDDEILYVGGINMHRSTNSGDDWAQISKWSSNPNMNTLNVPFVHADIHAMTFNPADANQSLIGHDGGVSLATNLAGAASANNAISNRVLGYNVTQFYYGDIAQEDFEDGGDFIGGSQDNGSQVFNDSNPNSNNLSNSFDPVGGDGSYSEIDDEGEYMILGFTSRNHFYIQYPIENGQSLNSLIQNGSAYVIASDSDGDFINVGELDSKFDIFYANSRTSTNNNSITACELGTNSATCEEIDGSRLTGTRATAMTASPFAQATPTLYVGTQDSRLLRINNAFSDGRSFDEIGGDDFLGSVSDIAFGATEQEIYLTMHNYGINNVWYSADGGDNWVQKDGNLPDLPIKAILKNPLADNEVILGTDAGVYATSDFDSDSPTWTQTINGMTAVKVVDLDLRASDNTILATTHGRGLFTGKFTTAGISDVNTTVSQLRVFPTRVSDKLNIDSSNNFADTTLKVYDLNGREVMTVNRNLGNVTTTIDVAGLSSGLYLLRAQSQGLNETIKFIKE